MLMHTKGILVMTPDSAMVLTGKQSLDFSGGVSAEDNFGIGGYDRVMGPNGQAQYWAPNLAGGLRRADGATTSTPTSCRASAGPRRADDHRPGRPRHPRLPARRRRTATSPRSGEIFSAETNPDRKKPFDIRTVMRAVADQDHPSLERWAGHGRRRNRRGAGRAPRRLAGVPDRHRVAAGPAARLPADRRARHYTAGTLFPRSSKKVARAINAASGNRPVVVLANLSGFDGSPESMRRLQLEYGAEIGRAIVNFDGPIVFCVVSRYHGGAFVVFSKALNPNMTVLAVEGRSPRCIGGAPAAAVVFTGEVDARTAADPRVPELEARLADAGAARSAAELATELAEVAADVRAEKLGEVAAEFDAIHNIQRAVEVGSVDAVIAARGCGRSSSPRWSADCAAERGVTASVPVCEGRKLRDASWSRRPR